MKGFDAHEITRQVLISLVLEPVAEKEGCTTRSHDLDESIRLQHLQAAGVNVGRYFYELVERVNKENGQPKVYFDLALEAIKDSQKNLQNSGKYINQGLITLFSHVVLSSLLTDGDGVKVCENVPTILKNSSKEDAMYRDKSLQTVWATSRNSKKKDFYSIEADNLFDYYQKLMERSLAIKYESGVVWSQQLINGLPIIQEMYKEGIKSLENGLIVSMEKSYEMGTKLLANRSPGFVADYTGVVGYLLLRDHPSEAIIH